MRGQTSYNTGSKKCSGLFSCSVSAPLRASAPSRTNAPMPAYATLPRLPARATRLQASATRRRINLILFDTNIIHLT